MCVRGHVYIQTLYVPQNGTPKTSLGRGKAVLGPYAPNLHLLLAMDPHIHQRCPESYRVTPFRNMSKTIEPLTHGLT